ncbi:peptide deformylase [Hymenobacter oligotrophus]|uniref:Peptide deformylase n=1 Tax=Hymenobacter oligotrophus TaxID=2319843 RepID=A0A3B7R9J7_9BACT|nr:peptide deformylase [Hymenobacter oligotrophus]AYA36296.1 peptide deformylase [Hymenobacter oligotrophus]
MPVREILQLGNPVLRQVAHPVADPSAPEVAALVQDLTDTVAHWRETTGYGRAIAAPQIGALKRVVLLRLPGREVWPLINPSIVARSPETPLVWDACLSFLAIFIQVPRHSWITVRYQDLGGQWHETRAGAEDDLAELLQHEIDHLDGILSIDRVVDVRSICTREEFERRYRADSPYGR